MRLTLEVVVLDRVVVVETCSTMLVIYLWGKGVKK